jgi:histone H3/H4
VIRLPKATIERIFRQGAGDMRVAQDAKDLVFDFVPVMAEYLAESAKTILDSANRKTLNTPQVEAVAEILRVEGVEDYDGEEFGRMTMRRILKRAGIERVASDALDYYNKLVCRVIQELGELSAAKAKEDDRKTIQYEDVEKVIVSTMPKGEEFLEEI